MTTDWSNPRHRKIKTRKFITFMKDFYPYIILLAALLLISLYAAHKGKVVKPVSYISTAYAAVATPSATLAPVKEDKRVEILRNFLLKNNSPLASYSASFIETADKYALDWTLMPAISGMESNFGKAMPKASNNPFGLGGGKFMSFPTLYSAIEFEGKLLSKNYKLAANNAIGSIYCPKYECNQNWAVIVTNFSEDILN